MPLAEIRGGSRVEIPNLAEIGLELDARLGPEQRREWWAELQAEQQAKDEILYRAIKDLRRSALLSSPAGTRVTILDGITPEAGYKWVVRYVGVWLATAGTGQAFITTDTSSALGGITQSKPVAVFTTSSVYQTQSVPQGACILSQDEGLYLNFTQNINGYMLAGWESPAEKVGRLS